MDGERDGYCRERKKSKANTIKTLRTIINLTLLMLLCYLQVVYPMAGMPIILQVFLWATYVGQIFILTTRLFGIRINTLIRVLNVINRKQNNGQ